MASWIYSLARNMATNQGESNQGNPGQVQGNQGQHNQGNPEIENSGNSGPEDLVTEILKQLVQENRALNAKVEAMGMQMTEMMGILQALKNGTTTEAAAVVNPGGTATILPTSGPAELVTAIPPPGSGVNHPAHAAQYEGYHPNVGSGPQGHPAAAPQARDKYQGLEERPKAIEEAMEVHDPGLALNVIPSPIFKVPNIGKFEGMTCPVNHVAAYCTKMFPLTKDDKLLTYYFRESLAGEALSWYMQEYTHTRCWRELANAFLERFNYNIGKAPNKAHLQNMAQRNKETFREYALRWRHLAAQAKPSLLEKEVVGIFMNTLPPLYYDKLVESASSNFKDLVLAGESLENGAKKGKTAYSSTETTPIAGSGNVSYSPEILPQVLHSSTQIRKSQKTQNYVRRKPEDFDPIPMSYSDLFDHLVSHDLISIRSMKPVQPPFPRSYDPEATCKFHAGGVGHSVEDCKALKHAVQDLIDSKHLNFNESNVNGLTVKESGETSAVAGKRRSPQYNPIPMSYADLCSHGWITPRKIRPVQPPFPSGYNPEATCELHAGAIGHSAENCYLLKSLVQGFIDPKQLTFEKGGGSSSRGLWTIKQG